MTTISLIVLAAFLAIVAMSGGISIAGALVMLILMGCAWKFQDKVTG